jgi:hypothetical protein
MRARHEMSRWRRREKMMYVVIGLLPPQTGVLWRVERERMNRRGAMSRAHAEAKLGAQGELDDDLRRSLLRLEGKGRCWRKTLGGGQGSTGGRGRIGERRPEHMLAHPLLHVRLDGCTVYRPASPTPIKLATHSYFIIVHRSLTPDALRGHPSSASILPAMADLWASQKIRGDIGRNWSSAGDRQTLHVFFLSLGGRTLKGENMRRTADGPSGRPSGN